MNWYNKSMAELTKKDIKEAVGEVVEDKLEQKLTPLAVAIQIG